MELEQEFINSFTSEAKSITNFLSYTGENGFHKFHVSRLQNISRPFRLAVALMKGEFVPMDVEIFRPREMYRRIAETERAETNHTGEIRFTPAQNSNKLKPQQYDNMARELAPRILRFMYLDIRNLLEPFNPESHLLPHGEIRDRAISISRNMTQAEIEEAKHKEHQWQIQHRQNNLEKLEQIKKDIAQTREQTSDGRIAVYHALQIYINAAEQKIAQTRDPDMKQFHLVQEAYLQWLKSYAQGKINKRATHEILPIPLNLSEEDFINFYRQEREQLVSTTHAPAPR